MIYGLFDIISFLLKLLVSIVAALIAVPLLFLIGTFCLEFWTIFVFGVEPVGPYTPMFFGR